MDDRKVGTVLRALRRRKAWRQQDVAHRAHVSQQFVAELESGGIEHMDLVRSRRVAAALGASLEFVPRWRGPELDRLLDRGHAALVDRVSASPRAAGWDVLAEWTFSHYGERGSIDLVGWHAATATLLIVEVKSQVVDIQALLSSVDRKTRLAPMLLGAERGWRCESVGRLLVLPEGSTSRDVLARHPASLGAAFPDRNIAIRRWLHAPVGPLSGVWLLRDTAARGTPMRNARHKGTRVRVPRCQTGRGPVDDAGPTARSGTTETSLTEHRPAQ